MFEHFTFGAQPQASLAQHEDVSASPTDCSFPVTSAAPTSYFQYDKSEFQIGGITDIVDRFSRQALVPDEEPHRSLWNEASISTPSFEVDASMEEEEEFVPEVMSYASTRCGVLTLSSSISSVQSQPSLPSRGSSTVACRRLQRQLNVQLQSCSSHIKDINSLVEDMISTNSQCRLHKSASRPQLAAPTPSITEDDSSDTIRYQGRDITPDEDEGFAEMDDLGLAALEEDMSLRRASAPVGIRKHTVIRWRRSTECMSSSAPGVARMKVRSMPRMRKRKVATVPEERGV